MLSKLKFLYEQDFELIRVMHLSAIPVFCLLRSKYNYYSHDSSLLSICFVAQIWIIYWWLVILDPPVLLRNAGSKLNLWSECAQQLLLKMYAFQLVCWRIIFLQCSISFWLKCILHNAYRGQRRTFTRYFFSRLLSSPCRFITK